MTYRVTVDRAMERGVAMGRYCQHCGCEFSTEIGAKASCTTCNNERSEAGLPAHSNVRPRGRVCQACDRMRGAAYRERQRAS